jgi:hypothetical protein
VSEQSLFIVYFALWATGFMYNSLYDWAEQQGYAEGYVWAFVAGGVLFTLGGMAVIDWKSAMFVLGGFAASGFWMIVGAMMRHARKRKESQEAIRSELDD